MRYLAVILLAVLAAACSSSPDRASTSIASSGAIDLGEFGERMGILESNGNYTVVNSFGYLGKYQMGECALIDAGLYTRDDSGCRSQDWSGRWTGAYGVDSVDSYLTTADAQDYAFHRFTSGNWSEIRARGLDRYIGLYVNGTLITAAGLLAGAHLGGVGGIEAFLLSGGAEDRGDANGSRISTYINLFNGIAPPPSIVGLNQEAALVF
ncbi:MAG: hypothetical protein ACFCVH_22675 [Alphaproteobacteria bacterium]